MQAQGIAGKSFKTIDLVIFWSITLAPVFPNLVLDGTVVERVTDLKVLSFVLDT